MENRIIYKNERTVVCSDYWNEDKERTIITYVELVEENRWRWFKRVKYRNYIIHQHVPYISHNRMMSQDESCNSYLRNIAHEEWMKAEIFKKEHNLDNTYERVDSGNWYN